MRKVICGLAAVLSLLGAAEAADYKGKFSATVLKGYDFSNFHGLGIKYDLTGLGVTGEFFFTTDLETYRSGPGVRVFQSDALDLPTRISLRLNGVASQIAGTGSSTVYKETQPNTGLGSLDIYGFGATGNGQAELMSWGKRGAIFADLGDASQSGLGDPGVDSTLTYTYAPGGDAAFSLVAHVDRLEVVAVPEPPAAALLAPIGFLILLRRGKGERA